MNFPGLPMKSNLKILTEDVLKTINRVYNIDFDVDENVNMSNQLNKAIQQTKYDHILNVVSMTLT